ncbi:Ribonuclease H-like superfamily [Sesbania bispinosa]|nr:Ribonuclease H-like superfamily [Sesbania bispinosa]
MQIATRHAHQIIHANLVPASQSAQPRPSPVHKWSPPPIGYYKLNTDIAKAADGLWGATAVVRDSEGIVLGAATWLTPGTKDATTAEALGLKLSLQFALDMGLIDLIVESDCSPLISAIQRSSKGSPLFKLTALDCFLFHQEFHNLSFNHVIRACNGVAHALAKFACSHPNMIWVEESPVCIDHIVALDILLEPI